MSNLLSQPYTLVWGALLGIALWFPVRQLIWVMAVRRAERKEPTDETQREFLKRRAGFTAALMCFLFAVIYTFATFKTPQ